MGREVLPGFQHWLGDHPKGLRRVGRSFRRSEMGGEVLQKVWDGSGNRPGGKGRVGGPSWRSGVGWRTL